MNEPIEKCENCLKMLPAAKMATHFGYCRRNIKNCQICGELYDINYPQQHEEKHHSKFKCQYCEQDFPVNQGKSHEEMCSKRPILCHYCEQNVPSSEYDRHINMCGSRTKKCEKCSRLIPMNGHSDHENMCSYQSDKKELNKQEIGLSQKKFIKSSSTWFYDDQEDEEVHPESILRKHQEKRENDPYEQFYIGGQNDLDEQMMIWESMKGSQSGQNEQEEHFSSQINISNYDLEEQRLAFEEIMKKNSRH